MHRLLIVLLGALFVACAAITDNIRETIIVRASKVMLRNVEMAVDLPIINADGSFDGVDYNDPSRALWSPIDHLKYLVDYARLIHLDKAKNQEAHAQVVALGLSFWAERRPIAKNPWWNTIGAPRHIRDILILSHGKISSGLESTMLDIMGTKRVIGTGANLIWSAELVFHHAILTKNNVQAQTAIDLVRNEIKLGLDQGVQEDGTFFQHGRRMQNFHYGKSFLEVSVLLGWQVRGSLYSLHDEQINVIRKLVFDGNAWLFRGLGTTPASLDRAVSRQGDIYPAGADVRISLALLMDIDGDNAELYEALIESSLSAKPIVNGVKNMYYGDLVARQHEEFTLNLKTVTAATLPTESINNENLLGWKYLHYGNHWILKKGDEFDGMMPVWLWERLPGAVYSSNMLNGVHHPLGASIVINGMSLTASKTGFDSDFGPTSYMRYFLTVNDLLLSVVSPIDNPPDDPMFVSLEQSRYRGRFKYKRQGEEAQWAEGYEAQTELDTVMHNDIGYRRGKNTGLAAYSKKQGGNWLQINERYNNSKVEEEVMHIRARILDPTQPSIYWIRMGGFDTSSGASAQILYNGSDGFIVESNGTTFAALLAPNKVYRGGLSVQVPTLLAMDGEDHMVGTFLDSGLTPRKRNVIINIANATYQVPLLGQGVPFEIS